MNACECIDHGCRDHRYLQISPVEGWRAMLKLLPEIARHDIPRRVWPKVVGLVLVEHLPSELRTVELFLFHEGQFCCESEFAMVRVGSTEYGPVDKIAPDDERSTEELLAAWERLRLHFDTLKCYAELKRYV